MRGSLLWWLQLENLCNCHSILPITWITVTTDASNRGWGAHCLTEVAQGSWDFPSWVTVSNILELWAAFQALMAFRHLTTGASVLLRLDNTTAVAYINEKRRYQKPVPATRGGTNYDLGTEESGQHNSNICTWDSECPSGLPLSSPLGQ